MADDAPHDGGSSRMEEEPNIIPLPPRVQPFDPATFARRTPADLLLRVPESHLSHDTTEVDSRFTRGYGSTTAKEWYMDLPDGVRQIVDETGFGLFCTGLSRLMASRTLLGALVKRWWDTTNSFHFSTTGDMTMTPYDFAMQTGLEVGGQPIPYNSDMGELEAAWTYLLGAHPPIFRSSGLLWVYAYFPVLVPELEIETPPEVPYSHRYNGRCCGRALGLCYHNHMAALGGDAIVCPISFCQSSGRFSISACARAHMGRAVNIASSSRARTAGAPSTSRALAADAPSTSRARALRGETRGMPSTRQCVGWPYPPIELTSWRYGGVPYQIPLEPLLLDRRYVRTPGSPPPSIEYVEGCRHPIFDRP
ncbi:hypothetical protein CsSME_00044164 [Camellia sinensis var. sinensis]